MTDNQKEVLFENRYDAGWQLAAKLMGYKNKSVIVLTIPNGGVPVALGVALSLDAELDLVVSRKIPLPLSPEGGFGAITDDGAIMLNDEIVKNAGLTEQQVIYQANKVRVDIRQRSLLFRQNRPPVVLTDKTAIIVDDGLATGYTMLAAVESIRHRRPREIVVAVPVAPVATVKRVKREVDKVITCVTGLTPKFYVADFYRYWHDPDDNEVLQCLKEWQTRRFRKDTEPLESK